MTVIIGYNVYIISYYGLQEKKLDYRKKEWTTGKKDLRAMKLFMQFLHHPSLCHGYFMALHSFLNLWFWNIPIRLSFNVWPSLVDGDEQGITTRVPTMM